MQANLVVRSLDGKTQLPIAKVVEYKGRLIVHAYVYSKYQRHSTHSWGVRYPLAAWMASRDIRELYLWDNKAKVTYCIDLDSVRELGTAGQRDKFGGTLNVPKDEWETIDHQLRVAWVPDDHILVLPQCNEPWPLPEREPPPTRAPVADGAKKPAKKAKPEPAGVQASLF